jgi:hypothetical protein
VYFQDTVLTLSLAAKQSLQYTVYRRWLKRNLAHLTQEEQVAEYIVCLIACHRFYGVRQLLQREVRL